MENLTFEKTPQTPQVYLNTSGELSIKGISTPHNVQKFYQQVFDWLNEYKNTNPKTINLTLEIEYLNTSSSRIFVELLVLVKSFKDTGTNLSITWRYEEDDEDIYDLGEDLRLSSKTEFKYITI